MRKRWMGWGMSGAALAALALMGGMADRAAAQTTARAWLGVTSQEITTDLREGLNYKGDGVLVSRVVVDSPADRAGIRKGDVLVSLNSRVIDTPEELVDVVRAAKVGQSIAVVTVRAGVRKNLSVKLGEWPEEELDSETPVPRAPTAPRAPKPPKAPKAYRYEWNGDDFEMSVPRSFYSTGRPRLGVSIQNLDEDMAEALNVPGGKGVLVSSVYEDSPAAAVGMKGGDVIVEVAGVKIDDTSDLNRELKKHEGKVSIVVLRRGARRTVQPELRDKSEGMWWSDGDRRTITIPDVRTRAYRDLDNEKSRADLEAEMRELREELRELKRQIESNKKN